MAAWDSGVILLGEGVVDGGGVEEGGGGHYHRRPGEEDGIERRARMDPVATDAAKRCGVDDRRESGARRGRAARVRGNPSRAGEGEKRTQGVVRSARPSLISSRSAGAGLSNG